MTILVTGGSKSGKSSFAESLLDGFSGEKIYIATMKPYGEEAFSAIERHRKMRKDKNFRTAEKYTDIGEVKIPLGSAVILECLGNLLANEMFKDGGEVRECADMVEKIVGDIEKLSTKCSKLVIVSPCVFSDFRKYTVDTAVYVKNLAEINRRIAEISGCVYECVYGIPVFIGGKNENNF